MYGAEFMEAAVPGHGTETQQLLTPIQAGEYLNQTPGSLAQQRYMGTGPAFVKFGARTVRYRQQDLDAWIESNVRTQTSRSA